MTDPVLISVITASATVIVAVIGVLGERLRRSVRTIRQQVQNDHRTNLRDDLDGIRDLVTTVASDLRRVDRGQATLISEVNLLRTGWQKNRDDIDELMDTEDRRRARREDR
jgi:hypothetical protein